MVRTRGMGPPTDDTFRGHGVGGRGQGRGCGAGNLGCGLRGGGPGGGHGQQRRVLLETALLLTLVEDRAHGYSLMEAIETLVGGLVCVDPGSVYRLLRSMEEAGCVVSSWQPGPAGPNRRVYTITDDGRAALAEAASYLDRRVLMLGALANRVREALQPVSTENAAPAAEYSQG
jgi:PadR family transcriptional regulator, regulatory protein PadR